MILDQVIKLLLYFCAIAATFMFLPGNILLDIKPKAFRHSLPLSLDKFIAIESVNVSKFDRIEPLLGPESIAHHKGRIVTGSSDGYLYEINADNTFKRLIKLINHADCEQHHMSMENKCGRPLGLKFDSKGLLFVVEPSFGVFTVADVFSDAPKVSLVFDIQQTITLGKASTFLDDIAIEEKANGGHVLYISDISTKFSLSEFVYILCGSENGRIIRYDTESKQVDVIVDKMFFPNGVELTQNNEALLFAEMAARSVWRYTLKGEQKGTLRKIVDMLPGEPDNIRVSARADTYWIGVTKPRTLLKPTEFDYYIKKPLLRKFLGRFAHMAGSGIFAFGQLIKSEYLLQLGYSIRTLQIAIPTLFPNHGGLLLEIDQHGNILDSIYSTENEDLGLVSEVREMPPTSANERVFYLGSFANAYLRKLVISK